MLRQEQEPVLGPYSLSCMYIRYGCAIQQGLCLCPALLKGISCAPLKSNKNMYLDHIACHVCIYDMDVLFNRVYVYVLCC